MLEIILVWEAIRFKKKNVIFLTDSIYSSNRNHKASKSKSSQRGEGMFGGNYKTI